VIRAPKPRLYQVSGSAASRPKPRPRTMPPTEVPIIIGAIATLVLLFPIFWGLGALSNPGLADSARAAPVVVSGDDCRYDPFASAQATDSSAEAAPMVWPIIDLIELTGGAPSPNSRAMAIASTWSLVGVPVPWALM